MRLQYKAVFVRSGNDIPICVERLTWTLAAGKVEKKNPTSRKNKTCVNDLCNGELDDCRHRRHRRRRVICLSNQKQT